MSEVITGSRPQLGMTSTDLSKESVRSMSLCTDSLPFVSKHSQENVLLVGSISVSLYASISSLDTLDFLYLLVRLVEPREALLHEVEVLRSVADADALAEPEPTGTALTEK